MDSLFRLFFHQNRTGIEVTNFSLFVADFEKLVFLEKNGKSI